MSGTAATVVEWVKENCLENRPGMEVTTETSLLATDIVDSLDFLNLVVYLNEKFAVDIDEDDMSPDNFETATSIAELIARLKSS